jgi:hypothetical protein
MLTAEIQTKLSWARVVESYDALPESFREAFTAIYPAGVRAFPYAVLTPQRDGFLVRANPKLVWSLGDTLYILERTRAGVEATCYAFEDISCVEVGKVLLKAWITIRGWSGDGVAAATRLEFNAVNDRLFEPFLDQMRRAPCDAGVTEIGRERAKFDYLERLNFKFMNFARHSIRPGDVVLACLFQPEIRATVVRLFGRALTRAVVAAHISVLTGRELIIVQDAGIGGWGAAQEPHYGGIWTYIPLDRIRSISVTRREDGLLVRLLCLQHGERIVSTYEAGSAGELNRLQAELQAHCNLRETQ